MLISLYLESTIADIPIYNRNDLIFKTCNYDSYPLYNIISINFNARDIRTDIF